MHQNDPFFLKTEITGYENWVYHFYNLIESPERMQRKNTVLLTLKNVLQSKSVGKDILIVFLSLCASKITVYDEYDVSTLKFLKNTSIKSYELTGK